MKRSLFLLSIIYSQFSYAQTQKSAIKSGITKSGNKSFYFENDRNGNVLFSVNNNMNGPLTMIFASEYDSLNRETISYSVHSNFGYFLAEKVYGPGYIYYFNYDEKLGSTFPYDQKTLEKINSKNDFIQLKVFMQLKNSSKHLNLIEVLDAANNKTKEIYLSEKGDTTQINYYRYNSKNQQTFFHYGSLSDLSWTWDIYDVYDKSGNRIKSYRVTSTNGVNDTTEVYNYLYNAQNKLVSENYYYKGAFQNRTEYSYNKKNQIIRELFYEGNETKLDVKTLFRYDNKGNVRKKTQCDYRTPGKKQKEVYKSKFSFW